MGNWAGAFIVRAMFAHIGGDIVCSTGETLEFFEACRMLASARAKYLASLPTFEIERRLFYRRATRELQQAISAAAMWRAAA